MANKFCLLQDIIILKQNSEKQLLIPQKTGTNADFYISAQLSTSTCQ